MAAQNTGPIAGAQIAEQEAPAMDYAEHERTYVTFMKFTEIAVIATINIVLTVAVWGMKGANYWAMAGLILTIVTAILGSSRLGWRPGALLAVVLMGVLAFG